MKLTLINPCNTYELIGNDPVIIKEQQGISPPLGILYIAAYLKQTGRYEVSVIDAQVENLTHAQVGERVHQINPDVVGVTAMTFTLLDTKMVMDEVRKRVPKTPIVVGGPHVVIYPEETISALGADYAVVGEGEITMDSLLQHIGLGKNGSRRIWRQEQFIQDLDNLPFPAREMTPIDKYFSVLCKETPTSNAFSSRGCPYACLTADTLINTIYGDISIKELSETRTMVPVYTYDPRTQEVFIADARYIQKIKSNQVVVRITFDDETHIDCTPDHRFLTFKNGNQFVELREDETEAKDLKPGMSVRVFREETLVNGYKIVTWARRSRRHRSHLVMEYILNRPLNPTEIVHHKDHNRQNDAPENLEVMEEKYHMSHHPELSERMKVNNPALNMTPEWRDKITKSQTGLKRTFEQKLNYARSKIGSKNPNWKGYSEPGHLSKYKEQLQINRRVKSVETLPDVQDVYCMEVPATHWFFANKVLVANCSFCDRPALGKGFRAMSAKRVVDEMEWCVAHGIKELMFYDDTFSVSKKRVHEICNEIKRRGLAYQDQVGRWRRKIGWDVRTRVNVVDPDLLKNMSEAGCERIHFGIESAVPRVLKELAKGITTEQVEDAFALCKQYGIKTLAYFMMGNPTETEEDVAETLKLSRRIEPDFMQMTILSPFPATEIYFRALKEGIIQKDVWKEYAVAFNEDFRPPLWEEKFTRHELESQLRWFYKKFYLTPKFVVDRVLEVRSFGQFMRYAKAGLSLLEMSLIPESKLKDSWRTRKEYAKGKMSIAT